ncbi:MAG TPA: DUF5302 domain-containing protein [Actinotalea caeni]|uniref:DUF5302 domain-containing protein n=1 Tax=Actinotalea caeni TaxID=1348467 RepID=UPI0012E20392|nr:DUF5302 domain-containing protein [Actinotalea caeni]HLV56261.1 DUF5302 domain-containing protein [Actinotalea caeni]
MSDDKSTEDNPLADAKAKMREALERKKEQEHLTAEGRRNTGQVHGSEVAGGRRMFRRKSGG